MGLLDRLRVSLEILNTALHFTYKPDNTDRVPLECSEGRGEQCGGVVCVDGIVELLSELGDGVGCVGCVGVVVVCFVFSTRGAAGGCTSDLSVPLCLGRAGPWCMQRQFQCDSKCTILFELTLSNLRV